MRAKEERGGSSKVVMKYLARCEPTIYRMRERSIEGYHVTEEHAQGPAKLRKEFDRDRYNAQDSARSSTKIAKSI